MQAYGEGVGTESVAPAGARVRGFEETVARRRTPMTDRHPDAVTFPIGSQVRSLVGNLPAPSRRLTHLLGVVG